MQQLRGDIMAIFFLPLDFSYLYSSLTSEKYPLRLCILNEGEKQNQASNGDGAST
jgi:hypothetical protein